MNFLKSVTAFGRYMIDMTKGLVEGHFVKANGYPVDAKVIYGDTDSVMVNFGVKTLEETMKFGREAAEYVSTQFTKPIRMEFEKVFIGFFFKLRRFFYY